MARQPLPRAEIDAAMAGLEGWTLSDAGDRIAKPFRFKNFSQAFAFMTRVALLAEKLDHHPEWSNVYSRVDVTLTTHDAEGLTELDFKLAAKMDRFAAA